MFQLAATNDVMLRTMVLALSIGVLLIVVARRFNLPAIVLLLAGGVVLGPAVWGDGAPVQPNSLGGGLSVLVSLAVGLILFEGGLTLDVSGFRSAPAMITRLLTIGIAVTWFGGAFIIWLILDTSVPTAILAASVVIVTGPTVIAPLLRRMNVNARLHSILHWEGVLIDPIGVFIAILCFEWIVEQQSGQVAIVNFVVRLGAGLALGVAGGFVLALLLRRRIIGEEMINVTALSIAVLIFGLAESVQREAGLLAVTAAGFVFGITGRSTLKEVRRFKAEITDLLIGTLFILLASRLEFEQFQEFGWSGLLTVALVILLRPVSILLCSRGTDVTRNEQLFLSWVAPRGIVAASIASLFVIRMADMGYENPKLIETFVYSVIIATIVLQGSTAGWLAGRLGVKRPEPRGWLIVGAHMFAREVAKFLKAATGHDVVLLDTNARAIRTARQAGLRALSRDAREAESLMELSAFRGIGNVLALTDNEDLNVRICQGWREFVGADHLFRYGPGSPDEDAETMDGHAVWSRLPRPTLLSSELARGDAMMIVHEGSDVPTARAATALLRFAGDRIEVSPSIEVSPKDDSREAEEQPPEPSEEESAVRTLFLQRRSDHLLGSIRPELVGDLTATDAPTLFAQLVDRLVERYPAVPRDELTEQLLEREAAFPTTLGHGVAAPHALCSALDARVCLVARVPNGVPFAGREDEPIRLVFLLVSPPGDTEGHLMALAEIARLVIDPTSRARLLEASSADELIELMRSGRSA